MSAELSRSPPAPWFSGDNPVRWTFDIQEYFDYHELSDTDRLFFVGRFFEHPASDWFHDYRSSNPDCSWQEFLEAVYRNFDPDAINFAEMRQILNKLTEAFAYLAKTNVKSDPIIEETVKNDDELPQAMDEAVAMVETKFPPKFQSPKFSVVVIGYVAEEISPSLGGVNPKIPNKKLMPDFAQLSDELLILIAKDDQNNNEMEDYLSDFHLEGKVVFNRGGVDMDLDFYFIPEVS